MYHNIASNAKYNNPEWIGKRFNMLTVVGIEHSVNKRGVKEWLWRIKCDCGTEKMMKPWYVESGHNVSCGCFRSSGGYMTNLQHGEAHTRLHNIWSNMHERCRPGNCVSHWHGDRGIKVCDEWKDYTEFAKWARENGYNEKLSIERIDNDGDYCPENCKWIKRPLQARNRRTTFWVNWQGRKMSLAEACEIMNVPYKQTFARIRYLGWPIEKALTINLDETRKWKRSERFGKMKKPQNIV